MSDKKIIEVGNSDASLPDHICPFASNSAPAVFNSPLGQQPGSLFLPRPCFREKCEMWESIDSDNKVGLCAFKNMVQSLEGCRRFLHVLALKFAPPKGSDKRPDE